MKKIVLDKLTIKQKIKLFNKLYNDIADCGINGDTELAHVNKYEAAVLRAMGGSGTVNKCTNLVQYFGGGGGSPPPPPASEQVVKQVSDLPEYAKPYVERLFARAEKAYQEPYVPYTGQRLAEVTPEQRVAFSGLESFLTEVDPVTGERTFKAPAQQELDIAKGLAAQGVAGLGDISAAQLKEKYMSPYQQAVTDIQKREFAKEAARREQQRATLAGKARAFGGSRDVLERMLGEEATQRGLSDIQATGSQKAYEDALKQFRADQATKMAGATQFTQLGQSEQTLGLSSLGALQAAGEAQRGLQQQPLDIAYEEFARQQTYPLQQIQDLSGIYRGFQMQPSTYKTAATYQAPPSLGQQLLGAGSVAAGIASGLGKPLFGAEGGLVGLANGGMVEKYKNGDLVSPDDMMLLPGQAFSILSLPQTQEPIDVTSTSPEDLMNLPGEYFPGESLLNFEPNYFDKLKEYKRIANLPITTEGGFEDDLNISDIADLPLSSEMLQAMEQAGEGDSLNIPYDEEKGGKPNQDDKKEKPFFNLEAALPYFQAAAQFTRPGQDTATAALAGLKEFAGAKKLMREAETEAEKRKIDKQYKEALASQALAQAEYMKKKPGIDFSKLKSEERDKLIESFRKQKEAYIKAQADSSGNPALVDKYQTVINELDVLLKRAMQAKYGRNIFTSTTQRRATEKKSN
jgi:hypothetical protein